MYIWVYLKLKVFSECICRAELGITFLVWGVISYNSPIPWKEEPGTEGAYVFLFPKVLKCYVRLLKLVE